jgi:hypothetical protein
MERYFSCQNLSCSDFHERGGGSIHVLHPEYVQLHAKVHRLATWLPWKVCLPIDSFPCRREKKIYCQINF